MISRSRGVRAALLVAAAVSVTGCSMVPRLRVPFISSNTGEAARGRLPGERVSIIAFEQKVTPADALKGQDFNLPSPQPIGDWPLPGATPEQSVEHVQAADNLSIAFRTRFGDGSKRGRQVTAPPVIADGKVFVMDADGDISARNAQTGREVWRNTSIKSQSRRDRAAFGGGMAYSDGKLYVTSGYRLVAQLDAATGATGWRHEVDQAIHGAPTLAGGRVMAVAIDNQLMTFDAATGEQGWTYQALSEPSRILAASSPAVSGDTVVAAFGSGELIALRVANGNDLWNEALSRSSRTNALSEIRDIAGRPVIYQGDVYAVSHSGVFAATDLRTGAPRWTLPVTAITTPWPAGDVVYVVSRNGEVICVSRENGQAYWVRDLNEGAPTRRRRMLGIGSRAVGLPVWSSPILASNRLITASDTGRLAALNPKTGAVERQLNLGSPVRIGPVASNGMVYIVTDEAELIALR